MPKSVFGRGSAPDPAGGAQDPSVCWRGDTPPHTPPHWARTYLRRSPCVPPEVQIYAYAHEYIASANPGCAHVADCKDCMQTESELTLQSMTSVVSARTRLRSDWRPLIMTDRWIQWLYLHAQHDCTQWREFWYSNMQYVICKVTLMYGRIAEISAS